MNTDNLPQTAVVDLSSTQLAALIGYAAQMNYEMGVGLAEEDGEEVIVARIRLVVPSAIQGAAGVFEVQSSFVLGSDSVPAADAWQLACHIAKVLHDRCMGQVVCDKTFWAKIGSNESEASVIVA